MSSLDFTQDPTFTIGAPSSSTGGDTVTITATANTGIYDEEVDFSVQANILVELDDETVIDTSIDSSQDDDISLSKDITLSEGSKNIFGSLEVDYYGAQGLSILTIDGTAEDSATVSVAPEPEEEEVLSEVSGGDSSNTTGMRSSYEGFTQFQIAEIKPENGVADGTGPTPERIQFDYANPSIGIDTGSNFVTHDIIGGATVRQRIGDKPLEIDISGVCKEPTAKQIELLRNADEVTLFSDRFIEGSITVHVASLSTDPMEDGGAADFSSGQFLYSFSLNCVEIFNTGD